MRWKAKEKPEIGDKLYFNDYCIIPTKFDGYWYWMTWMTCSQVWMGWRWSRSIDNVRLGKHANKYSHWSISEEAKKRAKNLMSLKRPAGQKGL